jgi:UDP-N-acetylmuramate--alanine ligase
MGSWKGGTGAREKGRNCGRASHDLPGNNPMIVPMSTPLAPFAPPHAARVHVPPHTSTLQPFLSADRKAPLIVRNRHVYMVGIGGCGMSGLARMLKTRGGLVSGSDNSLSPFTETLEREGVPVGFDHQSSGYLPEETELVIASAAIRPDHPQILEAERRGVPHLNYAEALGWAMVGMTGVCVAGTHGKSTTTAMLGFILAEAGLDPNVIVGANCAQLGGGFRLGAGTIPEGTHRNDPGLLVVEACEFNRSFHNYSPKIAVITSVEADHLDMYGSLDEVVKSFHEFAKLLPPASQGGLLLIAEQNAHKREVTAGLECAVETIGWSPSADWSVKYDTETRKTGLVRKGEGLVAAWVTPLAGDHNAMNAATACVLALHAGADPDVLGPAINQFKGLDRRMQLLGEKTIVEGKPPVRVYDDYGHHPTEVETTLRAMREFEKPETRGGRLICVFQPHQHSRTRHLLEEFASAFSAADMVIVPHIYFVRDSLEEKSKVTASDLVDRLRAKNVQALHLYPFEAIIEHLQVIARPGDLVIVMGAGPVDTVGRGFLKAQG